MSNKDKTTFNMRFAEINISEYSQYELNKEINLTKTPLVEFQSKFQFKVFKDEERISCLVNVKISLIETQEVFAELTVENIFEIKPFSDIVKFKSDTSFNIIDTVMISIASISIATVRGVLSEKLKGTFIQKEVYPLIDISKLFDSIKNS